MAANQAAGGFTLIELLVVTVILGIIISFATLSMSSGGAAAETRREAERLQALLRLASEEAVLFQREIGWRVEANEYRFYRLQDQKWKLISGDDQFHPRRLPPELQLELEVEGFAASPDTPPNQPQVVLSSSGEITPFRCRLQAEASGSDAGQYQISSAKPGQVMLQALPE
jgi:general secretion pathway protein H